MGIPLSERLARAKYNRQTKRNKRQTKRDSRKSGPHKRKEGKLRAVINIHPILLVFFLIFTPMQPYRCFIIP